MRLRQILYNLLGNAIKFSGGRAKRGSGELRVEIASEARLRVRFQVIDDGIGMSQEHRCHVAGTTLDMAVNGSMARQAVEAGVPLNRLMLELTECPLMSDPPARLDIRTRLRLKGARQRNGISCVRRAVPWRAKPMAGEELVD